MSEDVVSFVRASDVKKNNGVLPVRKLLPGLSEGVWKTSVCTASLQRADLIRTGFGVIAKSESESDRVLWGWGNIPSPLVVGNDLFLEESDHEYIGHRDLMGWPSDNSIHLNIAQRISRKTTISLISPEERESGSVAFENARNSSQ